MRNLTPVSTAFVCLLVFAPSPAISQDVGDRLVECRKVAKPQDRLKCYDALADEMGVEAAESVDISPDAILTAVGSGDGDSELFTTTEPWRVRWETEGGILTIELRTSQGQLQAIIGNQIGAGFGESEPQEPGQWRLAMRGVGAWRIEVVPAEDGGS